MNIANTSILADVGVIHGRFQILHNDHLKYLMAGKALCRKLVVGITNPDPAQTGEDPSAPDRHTPFANPLTYYERMVMVDAVLRDQGIAPDAFDIVPFPINFPDRYRYYVPLDALFFLTIYDNWGRKKKAYFESLGLRTHVLWEVSAEEKGISAADIRTSILDNTPWQHLVPPPVVLLMEEWNISQRLASLSVPPQN